MTAGAGIGLETTYWQRMADGRLPSLIPDTSWRPPRPTRR
jgi:hypothetical protein